MCGIAGFIDSENSGLVPERRAQLEKMCRVITHRGPDEEGIALEGRAALGMRRLSIIDLETGQQPIYSQDRSKLIVFNGEIYNYRELKAELEGLGYSFRTNSDTETIIHAFDEFGADCVEKLRGMFAFAIWDKKKQSLFVARDRVGKKPLFYSLLDNGDFVFGSELKCLLTHGHIEASIDIDALNAYLTFGYMPEQHCILRGVRKLLPGHHLTFEDGRIETSAYWDFSYPEEYPDVPETELRERLLEKVKDAVEARLISDVPLGAFLSGGVDSSAVVGLMSQIMDQPVKTFSIGFNEDSFDELKYARIASRHFKTDHHEFVVTPDLVDVVDDLVWHFDEPFSDSSALPTYMVSKLAREHVTVVLSGDGGDELFGGYTRYLKDRSPSTISSLPSGIREKLVRPLSEALPHGTIGKNYLFNKSLAGIKRYIDSVSQFGSIKKKSIYSDRILSELRERISRPEDLYAQIGSSAGEIDDLARMLYLDSKTYLPGDILTKVDRMTMAASLEARVPLLDQDLIDFVTGNIPSVMKIRGGETKYIFKKALEGIVPDEILYREKQGFGVPIGEWINTRLKEQIVDTLLENRSLERGYFERKYIETLVSEHQRGRRDHSHPLWVLWILELWHRRYIDRPWST